MSRVASSTVCPYRQAAQLFSDPTTVLDRLIDWACQRRRLCFQYLTGRPEVCHASFVWYIHHMAMNIAILRLRIVHGRDCKRIGMVLMGGAVVQLYTESMCK
jgi:hypothetical protein